MFLRLLCAMVVLCGCSGTDVFVGDGGNEGGEGGSGDGSSDGTATDTGSDAALDAAACQGKHPIVDGGSRYCEPGDCYCMPNDKCLPMGIAQACCTVQVKCN